MKYKFYSSATYFSLDDNKRWKSKIVVIFLVEEFIFIFLAWKEYLR